MCRAYVAAHHALGLAGLHAHGEGGQVASRTHSANNSNTRTRHARRTAGIKEWPLLATRRPLLWHCGAHTVRPETALRRRFLTIKVFWFSAARGTNHRTHEAVAVVRGHLRECWMRSGFWMTEEGILKAGPLEGEEGARRGARTCLPCPARSPWP